MFGQSNQDLVNILKVLNQRIRERVINNDFYLIIHGKLSIIRRYILFQNGSEPVLIQRILISLAATRTGNYLPWHHSDKILDGRISLT